ncbi:hypothetical protein LQ938_02645 [Microbacterium sp. cx-55]|uniref:hypothetical protein n=1 Tax=unclassified Microbacterium TaxID=2609290 RepID=UPI001CBAC9E6|nr:MULTISPECIES: hypothetical protein [unclassified Microbacterium]MBZ4487706.1 hypothetical protein [Microbacterium sp. cx-55]MCC4908143.1 hypothetical protein [Microbacterium sp. cx-59]UGB35717.1 hypothetical protein LQ938_02645 [Microbacterium sp. cx-55]
MTLLHTTTGRPSAPRRATFVAAPRRAPQITASTMALTAVVSGAAALAACAATLSITFL